MEIKTFDGKVADLEESINEALHTIQEENISLPEEETRLTKMLKNTEVIVTQEVTDIAHTVGMIKEGGFDVHSNPIADWAQNKLNITPTELGNFLSKVKTPEEAAEKILNIMETPKDIVSEVVNDQNKLVKK